MSRITSRFSGSPRAGNGGESGTISGGFGSIGGAGSTSELRGAATTGRAEITSNSGGAASGGGPDSGTRLPGTTNGLTIFGIRISAVQIRNDGKGTSGGG
jgi:hypothetical protein